MSKSIYLVALFVAFMFAANAEAQPASEETIDRRIEMLDEALDLSDEQEAEVRRIWMEHRAEMEDWAASNEGADREARRAHFRETAGGIHDAVRAVLTAEQAEKLDALREERREQFMERREENRTGREDAGHEREGQHGHGAGHGVQHGAHHGAGHGGAHDEMVQHIIDELALTESQRTEVESIFEAHHAAGMEWREANSDATQEEMQAFHEEHFNALQAKLQNTLSEDQLERLEEIHERMRRGMKHDGEH